MKSNHWFRLIFSAGLFFSTSTFAQSKIDIKLKGEWGITGEKDTKAIIELAAKQISAYLSHDIPSLLVENKINELSNPRTFDTLTDNRVHIGLTIPNDKALWSKLVFQFGHELCHSLVGIENELNNNLWFEESLCEVSSLFILKKMPAAWDKTPAVPENKTYGKYFAEYAKDEISDLKTIKNSLKEWHEDNSKVLIKGFSKSKTKKENKQARELSNSLAVVLLPLVEKDPQFWNTLQYLNVGLPKTTETFEEYLSRWHANCPEKYKKYVEQIAVQFEVKL